MESIDKGTQQSKKQVAMCQKYHKSKEHLFENLVHIVLQPAKKSTPSQLPASWSTEDRRAVEAGEERGQVWDLSQAGGAVAGPGETRGWMLETKVWRTMAGREPSSSSFRGNN